MNIWNSTWYRYLCPMQLPIWPNMIKLKPILLYDEYRLCLIQNTDSRISSHGFQTSCSLISILILMCSLDERWGIICKMTEHGFLTNIIVRTISSWLCVWTHAQMCTHTYMYLVALPGLEEALAWVLSDTRLNPSRGFENSFQPAIHTLKTLLVAFAPSMCTRTCIERQYISLWKERIEENCEKKDSIYHSVHRSSNIV